MSTCERQRGGHQWIPGAANGTGECCGDFVVQPPLQRGAIRCRAEKMFTFGAIRVKS